MPASLRSRDEAWIAALAALAALPFVSSLVSGGTFYYRDLYRHFLPMRLYLLEGLAQGQLRYWNPFLHEGEPSSMLPLAYPLDVLQLLHPSAWSISASLVLHVSLSAASFALLARALGHTRLAAATGALAYAWGGFLLSTLSFYFFVQAAGWAPLVVWACIKAGDARGWARVAPTVLIGLATSTLGLEIVAQALLVGLVLARPSSWARARRFALCLALGVGLCGYALVPSLALLSGSARAQGFSSSLSLAYSVHPLTLLQTLVGNLHSDLRGPASHFWGQRFFPGQTYFESLYLGPLTLCLAGFGLAQKRGRALGGLCLLGILVCLGHYLRLDLLLSWVPALRVARFPVKAFFLVQLCVPLLVASGIEVLAAAPRRWRVAAGVWLAGALLLGAGAVVLATGAAPGQALLATLLPASATPSTRADVAMRLGPDCGLEGLICAAAGLLALAAAAGRVPPLRAAAATTLLLAADLLRTGAGVNPMLPAHELELSDETRELAERLAATKARALVCNIDWRAYLASHSRPEYDRVAVSSLETLAPAANMPVHVRTALSSNATGVAPDEVCLAQNELFCLDVDKLMSRIVQAGVTHVLATRPLDARGLRLEATVSPQRIPLRIYVYELEQPLPFVEFSGGGSVALQSDAPGQFRLRLDGAQAGVLIVRERWARGWRAAVDGVDTSFVQGRRHLTLAVAGGTHDVQLDYVPPGLRAGVGVSVGALLLLCSLVFLDARRARHGPPVRA